MEIKHSHDTERGLFYVETEGQRTAVMVYHMTGPSRMVIDHTEVSESLSGKGVGKQLVSAAVGYARANNIKIHPVCPFAAAVFKKVEAFQDVLV